MWIPRHPRLEVESNRFDRKPALDLGKVHLGRHAQFVRNVAALGEDERQGHRVASRVCRAEELFRIRAGFAVLTLETASE